MATTLTLLVGLATGVLLAQLEAAREAEREQQQLSTARALSLVVDGRLRSYEGMLAVLAKDEALSRGDWNAFDGKVRRLLAGRRAWIVVGDRKGREYVNTRLAPGAEPPVSPPLPRMWADLDRGQFHVCDLTAGRAAPHVLCVDAPVVRDGKVAYRLSLLFLPQDLRDLLEDDRIPAGAIAGLIDRSGVLVFRSVAPDRYVGVPASPRMQAAIRRGRDGIVEMRSFEGEPMLVAFSRSRLSGWTFALATPRQGLLPSARALGYAVLTLGALALALAAGLMIARRITRALRRLRAAAARIREHGAPAFEATGLLEIDQVGEALNLAAAERAASDERFELAQAAGDIGAWEWDAAKDEGRVSGSYKQMHGLSDIEGPLRLGQVLHVIHRADRQAYLARLAAATQDPEPSTNEYRVVRPDGSVRWISAKGRPVYGADGAFAGAVGIVRDVTAERAARDAIHASQERLALALAAGRMAVWEVDANGRLVIDPAIAAFIGLAGDTAATLATLESSYLHGGLDQIRDAFRHARERGEAFVEVEFQFQRADGEVRWFNARAELRYGADGAPAGALGVVTDVTGRKRDEERLRFLMREVDHRANNLMSVVQGTVALSEAGDAEGLRAVITGRVQALARAHQLLAQSRWEGADLRRLVEEELAPFALADGTRAAISGPPAPLRPAAAQALAMALHELTTNAVKHGALSRPEGRVSLAWTVDSSVLRIRWEELGGPPVAAPARRGFGTTVLQRALGGGLGGRTFLSWAESGLRAELELPVDQLADEPANADGTPPQRKR